MEDEKWIELLDERFAKVDERFREAAMKSERIERELKMAELRIGTVGDRVDRLSNEITLPSGIVSQRFAQIEARVEAVATDARLAHVHIEEVHGEIKKVAEGVARTNEKLERAAG